MAHASGSLVGARHCIHRGQRILTGQLEVVIHVFQFLEVIFFKDNKSFELLVVSPGAVQTVYHMFLILEKIVHLYIKQAVLILLCIPNKLE